MVLEGNKTSKDLGIPAVTEIAAAEWAALPESEINRDDVVYFIPDGEDNSNNGSATIPDEVTLRMSELEQKIEILQSTISTMNSEMAGAVESKADKTGIVLTGDVTGTSVVDEETGNTMISMQRRGCRIYKSATSSGGWHEVAFLDKAKQYNDYNITFLVEKNYNNNKSFGILKITTRITPSAGVLSLSATWEINSGLTISNYVVTHNVNSQDHVEIRLWAYENTTYQCTTFNVLSETHGTNRTTELWELKNYTATMSGIESIPEEYTQIPSTLATIQNPVTEVELANNVFGYTRYASGSSSTIVIPFERVSRYFCMLTATGAHGVDGRSPIVFVLELPYDYDAYDPRITYIYRQDETYEVTVSKNDDNASYTIQYLMGTAAGVYLRLGMIKG